MELLAGSTTIYGSDLAYGERNCQIVVAMKYRYVSVAYGCKEGRNNHYNDMLAAISGRAIICCNYYLQFSDTSSFEI